MNEQDEESLAEWLFFARKHRQRRTTHTTHSSTNTEDEN